MINLLRMIICMHDFQVHVHHMGFTSPPHFDALSSFYAPCKLWRAGRKPLSSLAVNAALPLTGCHNKASQIVLVPSDQSGWGRSRHRGAIQRLSRPQPASRQHLTIISWTCGKVDDHRRPSSQARACIRVC